MALTGLDQNKPTVTNVLTGINGQINTPITTDGTYLYFGTWPGGSAREPTISQALRLLGEDLHPRQLRLSTGPAR